MKHFFCCSQISEWTLHSAHTPGSWQQPWVSWQKNSGTVKVQTPFSAKLCLSSTTTLAPSFSVFIKKEKDIYVSAWSIHILRELKRHCKTWSLYFRLQYVCTSYVVLQMLLTLRILHVVPEEGSRSALPPPTRSTASFHCWSSFLYCYSFFLILRKFRHLHRESQSRRRDCSEAVLLQVWGSLQTLIE